MKKKIDEIFEEAVKHGIDGIYETLANYKIIESLWDRGKIYRKLRIAIVDLLQKTYETEGTFF